MCCLLVGKMNAVEIEPNVQATSNFVNQFFGQLPIDATKYRSDWTKILPGTSFSDATAEVQFTIAPLEYPYAIEIANLLVSCRVKILKKDGGLPTSLSKVTLINNMMHSLFSFVSLQINDHTVTQEADHYHYKAYLENLMTYSKNPNDTWNRSCGFSIDSQYDWHGPIGLASEGYTKRTAMFREHQITSNAFSDEGAHFIGKLYHVRFLSFNYLCLNFYLILNIYLYFLGLAHL